MKVDRLFIAKDCPDCAEVRAALNVDAVIDDDFRGKSDQELRVFSALSDSGARELIDAFAARLKSEDLETHIDMNDRMLLHSKFTPVLVTFDGEILDKPGQIVVHLQDQGMARDD